jgi:hypothetical protein
MLATPKPATPAKRPKEPAKLQKHADAPSTCGKRNEVLSQTRYMSPSIRPYSPTRRIRAGHLSASGKRRVGPAHLSRSGQRAVAYPSDSARFATSARKPLATGRISSLKS